MRKQEMKYYILACIGIPTSIFLFIALATFMTMADDLDRRIVNNNGDKENCGSNVIREVTR